MSDNFFAEFARPSYQPPPGFELVDDNPTQPPRATTVRGLEAAGASGINAGIAGTLGGPVDVANTALYGLGLDTSKEPIMGSAWLRDLERRVGIRPDLVPGATTAERIAHAAGYGAAATMAPAAGIGLAGEIGALAGPALETAQAVTGAPTGTTAALGAAAGGAGGAAAEAAPEGLKTAAQLAAQLATGHAAGKAISAVTPAEAPPSNIEQFLTQADEASARAAGAKTRAEIDEFIRNKETANAPRIGPPVHAAQGATPNEPEGIGQGPPSGAPGIQTTVLPVAQTSAPAQSQEAGPLGEIAGTRQAPAKIAAPADIEPARTVVDTAPSPAQAEAGNYQKGHVNYDGLPVTIENPKGSIRSGEAPDGTPWSSTLPADYGYVKGSVGKDGDHVDIFLGDKGPNGKAFVIDQNDPATGKFDEHKIVAGVDSHDEALNTYFDAFPDGSGPSRLGAVTEVPIDQLKTWLAKGQANKPFAKPSAPPAGFEAIAPGIAPNFAGAAQLAEKPAKTTPEIAPELRERAQGLKEAMTAGQLTPVAPSPPLGLRPIDVDPQAAVAAKHHEAAGAPPDVAYEHAVIEAALADPKVQGIQDGEQLPATPEPIQNAPAAAPEPRPAVKGAGATQVPEVGKGLAPGAPEAKYDALKSQLEKAEKKLAGWGKSINDPTKFRPVAKAEWDRAFDAREKAKDALAKADPTRFRTDFPDETWRAPGEPEAAPGVTSPSEITFKTTGDFVGKITPEMVARRPDFAGQLGRYRVLARREKPFSSIEAFGDTEREARENALAKLKGGALGEPGTVEYPQKVRNEGGFLPPAPSELTDAAGRPHVIDTSQPSDAIANRLLKGGALSREEAAKLTGHDLAKPEQLKAFEENVELGVVKAARHIVRYHSGDEGAVFDTLAKLYNDQPKLGTRTSSSMRDQAYSTPIPLAYAASRLAGVGPDKTVYEPSAGNGALLIEAHAVDTVANELNPGRLNALKSQGFLAMNKDASLSGTTTAATRQNDGPFDIVLANPPFGARHGEGGAGDRFDLSRFQPGYETGEIDHAIALNSLAAMKPDGRAVLILGGPSPLAKSDEARTKAYGVKAKREFYKTLYDKFNVSDHFTVAGDLYEKQGAGWPVDIITISGAGRSSLPYPMMTAPPMLKTWGEVKEKALAQQPANPQPVDGARNEANAPGSAVGTAGHDLANQPANVGRGDVGPANRPEVEPAALRGANVPPEHEHREPPAGNQPAERPSGTGPGGTSGPSAAKRRPSGVEPRPPRAPPPQPEAPKEAETENQVAYSPKSTAGTKLGTLVPRNMRDATDAALASVEARHGPISKYVAGELGYKHADLGKYYSAEQVDALGLAIDNIEHGAALVLGDQTGIGKGRVLAGLIRYGIRQKMTPIFVTEKPRLYAAMFDDMTDTGMQDMLGREPTILPTNTGLKLPVGTKGTILKTPNGVEQDQQLRDLTASGKLPDHDMIMTTYAQMQTVKGADTTRRDFLRTMAPNAIILFDESHNAGGAAVEKRISKNKLPPPPDRAEFARELVQNAKAVVYSSATYAKRPDSMRLYSKTDMRYAVPNMKDLGEAIKKGGVPMQQVVAAALAESGQYLRRERSFDGIRYDMEVTPIDRALYAGFSKALRAINDFSKAASASVKAIDREVKAEAAIAGQDASVGTSGAESTNFTSLMHNVVAQFLLASKAERAGQLAVEAINRGERPVITVANTLESFVSDYMEQTGTKTGDLIKAGFGDLLSRYLDRSRVVTIKKPFGAVTDKHTMTDEELGPAGIAAYHAAQAIINGLDFGKLPISPIDRIRQVISQAGHAVSEITGRSNILDYGRGNIPQIMTRSPKERSEAGAAQTIKDFNSGKLKALVLNESGATGISLHDSEAFPESGRGQRAMIIAQAHPNIDTHMQMLGRVNRTGQLSKPRYAQLGADVAAEKRPMAVLAKKLASLNANTTASAKGGLSAKGAVDFLNRYGDEVVTQVMLDDMRAHIDMGEPLGSLNPADPMEDAARKMTGRIAFLEPDAQDRIMDAIESQYTSKIADLDERGENVLEAKLLDLKAKYEGGADISQKSGESPFQDAVHVGTYDVKSDRKPPKFDDVMKSAYAMLGREIIPKYAPLEALQTAGGKSVAAMMTRADQAFDEYKSAMRAITKDPEVAAEQNNRLADSREAMRSKLAVVYPGAILHLNEDDNVPLPYALAVGVKHEGKTLNPYAASSWQAVLAFPGYGTRTVPFSQLGTRATAEPDAMQVAPASMESGEITKMFDSFKTELREKRVIATGNLLAAYDLLRRAGQIVHFTTDSGDVKQGILLPRKQTSYKDVTASAVKKLADPSQIIKFLEKPGGEAVSADDVIKITSRPYGGFLISVAGARSIGGKYFLDPGVLEALGHHEFIKRGAEMRATADEDTADAVFEALIKAGATFQQGK